MKILAKTAATACAALILLSPGTGCWTALAGDFAAPDEAMPAGGVTAVPGMNLGQMPTGAALPFEALGADAQIPNLGALSPAQIMKLKTAPAALPQAGATSAARAAMSAASASAKKTPQTLWNYLPANEKLQLRDRAAALAESEIQAKSQAPKRRTILGRLLGAAKAVLSGKNRAQSAAAAKLAGERTFDGLGQASAGTISANAPAVSAANASAGLSTSGLSPAGQSQAAAYPPYRPDMVKITFRGGTDQMVYAWDLFNSAKTPGRYRGMQYFNFDARTQTALALLPPSLYYRFDEARKDILSRDSKAGDGVLATGIVTGVEPVPVAKPLPGELRMYLESVFGKARILSVLGVQNAELKSGRSGNYVAISLTGQVPETQVKREMLYAAPWLFRYPAGYVRYEAAGAPAAASVPSAGDGGRNGAMASFAAISLGVGFLHVGVIAGMIVGGALLGGYIGRRKGLASRAGGGGGYWDFGTPLYSFVGGMIGALKAKADHADSGDYNFGDAIYGLIGALIGAAVLGTAAAALGAHFLAAHAVAAPAASAAPRALGASASSFPGFPPSWTTPPAQAYAPNQGLALLQALKAMLPALKVYAIGAAAVMGAALSFYGALLLTELRALKSGKNRKRDGSSGTPKA